MMVFKASGNYSVDPMFKHRTAPFCDFGPSRLDEICENCGQSLGRHWPCLGGQCPVTDYEALIKR